MRICIATPAPPGSRKGNRITAERWARLVEQLGHTVYVVTEYAGEACDLLVGLHALKSQPSLVRFREQHPRQPIVLGLTGTDLYHDIHTHPEAARALEIATRLVTLQPLAGAELPPQVRDKVRVIYQSVEPPPRREPAREGVFEVCVMGHLRTVKDPFRTALAAQLLPESSRIKVLHLGAALTGDMAEQARDLAAGNPRYQWLGDLPWAEAMGVLSRCRLLSLTSQMEGGANVIGEAVTLDVPVVASRVAGSVGLLGEDYPGYFAVGDTRGLADLLGRAESEAGFYKSLSDHCRRRRGLFDPARERQSWQELLGELFPGP
jgi:putative glycosyltransferase (TIGR04348 family)